MSERRKPYPFDQIELKWQALWDEQQIFHALNPGEPGFDPNSGWNPIFYPGGQMPAIPPGYSKSPGMPMMGPDPSLGGPLNSPQPVPGGAPRPFDPSTLIPGIAGSGPLPNMPNQQAPFNPSALIPGITGSGPLPTGNLAALGLNPASLQRGAQGAAQLGAGLNQSGMVTLRSPDGRETKQMSQADAQHWLQKGAQMVTGAF